jgi:hypothetical protein
MKTNVIIGDLSEAQFNELEKLLAEQGYKRGRLSSKVMYSELCYNALKIDNQGTYQIGTYDRYVKYIKTNAAYADYEVCSFEDFVKELKEVVVNPTGAKGEMIKDLLETPIPLGLRVGSGFIPGGMAMQQVEEPVRISSTVSLADMYAKHKAKEVAVETSKEERIELSLDRIRAAYELAPVEFKIFMRNLFGSGLFVEKEYKVGDSFTCGGRNYKLIQLAATVITMLDTESYVNFCKSQAVNNIKHITERELQQLLGIHYSQFKLVG